MIHSFSPEIFASRAQDVGGANEPLSVKLANQETSIALITRV